jgi:uncharacterized damage-inducible protein DinB
MLAPKVRSYLMEGLAATPVVVADMLRRARPEDYDRRPFADRFTLREVLAHMADWEGVWLERLERMRDLDNPLLQGYDEGQWAIEHDYASADPMEQLVKLRDGRAKLLATLRALPGEGWERTGQHSEWGSVTISSMAALVLGHDGYHTRQISEWLDAGQAAADGLQETMAL